MEVKKVNKRIVFSVIAVLLLIAVVAGATYAYFSAGGSSSDKVITSGTLRLEIEDGNNINANGIIPNFSTTKTFTVKNTGTLDTYYSLSFKEVVNTFAINEDLIYSITSTNDGGSVTNSIIPMTDASITDYVFIEAGETQDYTLTFTYVESGKSQNIDMGQTFSAKLNIESQKEPDLIITNAEQLAQLATDVDNGNSYEGKIIAIANDIDLSSVSTGSTGFNPIGYRNSSSDTKPFAGTLVGGGHTLSNLYINSTGNAVGLISNLTGTVRNLKLSNVNVTGKSLVAGLAGNVGTLDTKGNIIDCYVEGTVLSTEETASAGSLAGLLVGQSMGAKIENNITKGTVTGNHLNVGGLAGGIGYSTINYAYSTATTTGLKGRIGGIVGATLVDSDIINTHSNSTIIINGNNDGDISSGGVIGYLNKDSKLSNSFSNSIIIANTTGRTIGGVAGRVDGHLINAYSNATIELNDYTVPEIGGVVGRIGNTNVDSSLQLVKNVYSNSTITGTQAEQTGGICGINICNETDRVNGRAYLHLINSYSLTNINGVSTVGGICGQSWTNISNSYAEGNVNGTSFVGPIVGYKESYVTLDNVYSLDTQQVTGTSNTNNETTLVNLNTIKTTDWFKNTLKFDNSWKYTEGYYPLLYKLDENGNPTNQLLPGQNLRRIGN